MAHKLKAQKRETQTALQRVNRTYVLCASLHKICNTNTAMAHKLKAQKYEAQTV